MPLSSRALAGVVLFLAATSRPAAAQARRALDRNDPQAQLMGYYAAVMQFTPVGLPDKGGRLEIGGAGSVIPSLSLQDRLVGFGGTKLEDANKCPVYPRLAAAKGVGGFTVELGYTPPVTVCGVTASVFSAAFGRRFPLGPGWDGFARASGIAGSLRASITCSPADSSNPLNQTCYNGTPSSDRIAPFGVALDFSAAYQGWQRLRIEPYLTLGFRYERVNFNVNYTRTAAQGVFDQAHFYPALDDHERLQATLARIQVAAGGSWAVTGRIRLGGELFYAPQALLTVRGRASIELGGSR